MHVTLLSHTPDALNLLLRTKNTRLKFTSDPSQWTDAQRAEHLAYMRDTIKSSWEFVDYTFEINGVTRAFTHQLVRTRAGSYAQETHRAVDVRDNDVLPPTPEPDGWAAAVGGVMQAYAEMIEQGTPMQDARGILPTNITTNIIAKFSLRTLSDMARIRLCVRTQGEYQDVFRAMRAAVLAVHPWAEDFIQVECCASGTCAFPRYGRVECGFWDDSMDRSETIHLTRNKFWSGTRAAAVPVAKQGRTM